MGDIIINQQRNDGYSHQNRSSFASFLYLTFIYMCVFVVAAFSARSLTLSFGYIFICCIVCENECAVGLCTVALCFPVLQNMRNDFSSNDTIHC